MCEQKQSLSNELGESLSAVYHALEACEADALGKVWPDSKMRGDALRAIRRWEGEEEICNVLVRALVDRWGEPYENEWAKINGSDLRDWIGEEIMPDALNLFAHEEE